MASGQDKDSTTSSHTSSYSERERSIDSNESNKEFKANHIDRTSPDIASRLIDRYCLYVTHVTREAELRESGGVLDVQGYISMRRETGLMRCFFDLAEHCLGVNLPQEVHNDPVFVSGYEAAMDLINLSNDLYSYDMEQAKGHSGANIVTVFMKTNKMDLQTAVDFLGTYLEALIGQWATARATLSSRSEQRYRDSVSVLDALGDWVRGNVIWCFETDRYFGINKDVIRKTLRVTLTTPFSNTINFVD
ncbi:isoprenoid synthase domain-containing protein [Rhodocollybia butyracea]|uniref:Terpene synthase n=1 Tax=Rhodocollybia butyracea TaxID=206335 RepID=A0A9P5P718_9AGAR|nr:isoprenoid synthase domain-containing protein [Rhodocollybia butyracea]